MQQSDDDRVRKILETIRTNVNKSFHSEKKLAQIFEQIFAMQEPRKLVQQPEFEEWVAYDMKKVIQEVRRADNLVNCVKMLTLLRLD